MKKGYKKDRDTLSPYDLEGHLSDVILKLQDDLKYYTSQGFNNIVISYIPSYDEYGDDEYFELIMERPETEKEKAQRLKKVEKEKTKKQLATLKTKQKKELEAIKHKIYIKEEAKKLGLL